MQETLRNVKLSVVTLGQTPKAIIPTPPIMQLYVLVTGPHSAASITLRIFFLLQTQFKFYITI